MKNSQSKANTGIPLRRKSIKPAGVITKKWHYSNIVIDVFGWDPPAFTCRYAAFQHKPFVLFQMEISYRLSSHWTFQVRPGDWTHSSISNYPSGNFASLFLQHVGKLTPPDDVCVMSVDGGMHAVMFSFFNLFFYILQKEKEKEKKKHDLLAAFLRYSSECLFLSLR